MKKILVTTLVAGAFVASTLAQGTINLAAGSNKIRYTLDGTTFTSVPTTDQVSTNGTIHVGLYVNSTIGAPLTFNPDGTVGAGWVLGGFSTDIAPTPGFLAASVVTLPSGYVSAVQAAILGWTGNFSSYNAAVLSGTTVGLGYAGSPLSNLGTAVGSSSWTQATGNPLADPPTSAVAVLTGSAGFNGLVVSVVPVPEPSSFALAGLGLAALTIFRRRK